MEKLQERSAQRRWEYPAAAEKLDRLLPGLTAEERQYLEMLWALLEVRDLVSVEPETLLGYVRASLRARAELPYIVAVPEELFVPYVLFPRVNNEQLDGSREWLFSQIAERVKGKTLLDAALEINLWCCQEATYQSTDDRTIAPLGMCRRAFGRCGEESTLAVSALRAAGIPARQVYSPRWAHCDDNHAWVEFWAEDGWHYLGACEPEPVADEGWFISAASRAMLVRAIAPAPTEGGCQIVNTLSRYADTAVLTVHVERAGQNVPGVPVRFQLVNDSQLHTLYEEETDAAGCTRFETGLGCLVVSAYWEGHLVERAIDVRAERTVTLRWEDGFDPQREERRESWRLRPPAERVPAPSPVDAAHRLRLRRSEALRGEKVAAFSRENDDPWLEKARGNREELARFQALEDFDRADKDALLGTLTDKDFADVTCEALADALAGALPWRGRYPRQIWVDWLLPPRVEHETLLPIRRTLQQALAGKGLTSGEAVLDWMAGHIRPLEDHGITDRRGSGAGYLADRVCPRAEWNILAVQLCRALGIPARLRPEDGAVLLTDGERVYCPGETQVVHLRLMGPGEPVFYREHFTLARWTGEDFQTLALPAEQLGDHWDLSLHPGSYRLTTNRRQIDGTAGVQVQSFLLREDRAVTLSLQADETAAMLKEVPLPPVKQIALTDADIAESSGKNDRPSLLIFAQPGAEPTEHLLLELLELREAYRTGGWPIRLLLEQEELAENPRLREVLEALPESRCALCSQDERFAVQQAMGVGDYRQPLAVAVDREGRGVYACANYNIRSAHTLLKLLRML